jgi:uncharacterized protein (TIGR02300 family)
MPLLTPETRTTVAKADLGTKRICPETGRKFYDLNKDPIVSPFTGISYPRSMFEAPASKRAAAAAKAAPVPEPEEEKEEEVATISLEEADEESSKGGAVKPEGDDDIEEAEGDDADDTFLPEEEEDGEEGVEDIVGDVDEEEA